MEPRIYSVSLFRDGVFCIIENFDGILYDIKSPVNYILYIGGLEIMMGFREFAKSQYDTIKLRDPALREEKEVFLYPYVKALYWHRVAHELYKKGEFYKARKISQKYRYTFCLWDNIYSGVNDYSIVSVFVGLLSSY